MPKYIFKNGPFELKNTGVPVQIRLYEPTGSGENYTAIQAQAQVSNITYTLPSELGNDGDILSVNSSGSMSWISPSQGPQGDIGPQGVEGAQGVQGPEGAQGPQGDIGPQGVEGAQGVQGPEGAQGPQGDIGPQGVEGAQGVQGAQGPQGDQGIVGINWLGDWQSTTTYVPNDVVSYIGSSYICIATNTNQYPFNGSSYWSVLAEQGMPGAGSPGEPGAPGPAGLYWMGQWNSSTSYGTDQAVEYNGSSYIAISYGTNNIPSSSPTYWQLLAQKGAQGSQGPQGFQGDAGGPQGPQGSAGAQGATGAQGSQGVQGNAGAQGATGPQGNTGSQGPQGAQGVQGSQGPQGSAGAQGATGAQGPQGAQGSQGLLSNGTTTGATTYWNGTSWVLNSTNIYNNGSNVGIGTVSPSQKLDVNGGINVTNNMFVSGNSYIGNASSDLLLVTASSYFAQPIIVNSNQISGSSGGNIELQSAGVVKINGDLFVNGNNVYDSTNTYRLALGTTTTINATTTSLTGDLQINGNDIKDSTAAIRFTLGSDVTMPTGTGLILGAPSNLGSRLTIKQASETGRAILFERSDNTNRWGFNLNTANALEFAYNGGAKGFITGTVGPTQMNFTGQHRTIPENYELFDATPGLIVVSAGVYDSTFSSNDPRDNVNINEALPKIKLSNSRNQKSIFGVVSDKEDDNSMQSEYIIGNFVSIVDKKSNNDRRVIVNALGEGGIWVTNINGNLQNGDYITTCEIPGYGMKQDSEFLANYTVAKITCDCTFDLNSQVYRCEEFVWNGQTYRKAFVGCTYHCG